MSEDTPWNSNWYDIREFNANSNWVTRVDDDIVGYLISFLSKNIPYISVIAVMKEYQHIGTASKMVKESINYWKSKGYEEIRICVDHDR